MFVFVSLFPYLLTKHFNKMTEAYIILSGSIPKHTTELSNRAQDTATKLLSIYFTTHKDDQAVEELLLHLTVSLLHSSEDRRH